jgi:hypothetical protein
MDIGVTYADYKLYNDAFKNAPNKIIEKKL